MKSHDLRIDVTGEVDLPGRLEVAVTVHAPDSGEPPAVVAVALPGGGYNRRYYDLDIDRPSYSQAEYHTARGWVVVACDPLDVGESSPTGVDSPTITQVAAAHAAAVRVLRARLAAGDLVPGLAAAPDALVVGLGQSMGGCFTIVAQGTAAPYDAVGILGFSGRHTVLPLPEGGYADIPAGDSAPDPDAVAAALAASFGYAFHWEDVPAEIVEQDLATVPFRQGPDVPHWGSAPSPAAVGMLAPGVVAAEAAAITVPVLVAVGERDVVPDARLEPVAYAGSTDITVVVVPRMAHMHNFASTREAFWRRIHTWAESLRA